MLNILTVWDRSFDRSYVENWIDEPLKWQQSWPKKKIWLSSCQTDDDSSSDNIKSLSIKANLPEIKQKLVKSSLGLKSGSIYHACHFIGPQHELKDDRMIHEKKRRGKFNLISF